MSHLMPEGDNLKAAIRFITEERESKKGTSLVQLVDAACIRFDLTPGEGEFLMRFVRESEQSV